MGHRSLKPFRETTSISLWFYFFRFILFFKRFLSDFHGKEMTDNDDSEKKRESRSEAEAEDDRQASRRKQRKEQQQQLLEEQPLPNRTVSFSNIVGEKIIRDEK